MDCFFLTHSVETDEEGLPQRYVPLFSFSISNKPMEQFDAGRYRCSTLDSLKNKLDKRRTCQMDFFKDN